MLNCDQIALKFERSFGVGKMHCQCLEVVAKSN